MSTISARDVMALRSRTNAPMMDCKAALEEAGGDMDKAADILRKKNAAIQEKKAGREAAEGRIAVYVDPEKQQAAIVELRCESAPVAGGDDFKRLADDLARHIACAPNPPMSVDELLNQPFIDNPKQTVKDRIGEVVFTIRENMRPARFERLSGGQFGSYVHFDGSVGVLLQVSGDQPADTALLKDICMHIAARQPAASTRDELPAEVVEREKEIIRTQAAATGKPPNIVEKIAEGMLRNWFAENVLTEQQFVKDPKKKVGDLLQAAGLKVMRFVRYRVGEIPA